MYIVILRGYIQDIYKYCHEGRQPVLKPYNPMKIWEGWGHKHDRDVHRFYIKRLTDSSTIYSDVGPLIQLLAPCLARVLGSGSITRKVGILNCLNSWSKYEVNTT